MRALLRLCLRGLFRVCDLIARDLVGADLDDARDGGEPRCGEQGSGRGCEVRPREVERDREAGPQSVLVDPQAHSANGSAVGQNVQREERAAVVVRAHGEARGEHDAVEHDEGLVRHEVLPAQREQKRSKLDDPNVVKLRREPPRAEEASRRGVELHDAEEEAHDRRRVKLSDGAGPARGPDEPRARVGGGERDEDDDCVCGVLGLGAEFQLGPDDDHAGQRP
mmetsp:Transcript_18398/g.62010  ORF Transcript_18398/g.62010 Transcript_18398/m.62010 type:complete len:223 (+) Transcript_18398:112-780(+)